MDKKSMNFFLLPSNLNKNIIHTNDAIKTSANIKIKIQNAYKVSKFFISYELKNWKDIHLEHVPYIFPLIRNGYSGNVKIINIWDVKPTFNFITSPAVLSYPFITISKFLWSSSGMSKYNKYIIKSSSAAFYYRYTIFKNIFIEKQGLYKESTSTLNKMLDGTIVYEMLNYYDKKE